MTAKQKLAMVVAQYAARAREATRAADAMADMAGFMDEKLAERALKVLNDQGLIDSDGVLHDHAVIATSIAN